MEIDSVAFEDIYIYEKMMHNYIIHTHRCMTIATVLYPQTCPKNSTDYKTFQAQPNIMI